MRALVVGGAGYIGFEVAKALRDEYSVYILDIKRNIIPIAIREKIKCLVDDVSSAVSVRQHYDVIVNLTGGLDDAHLYGVNEQAIKQVCAPLLLRQMSPAARIIHVSTQYVYDGSDLNKERVKELPVTDYGRVQLMAEYGIINDPNAIVLRCGTVIGKAQYPRWDTWGNHLISAKAKGESVYIYHPNAMICLLTIENIVEAVKWAVTAEPGAGTYNVADVVTTRLDAAKRLLGKYPITVHKSDTPDISVGMDVSRIIKAGFEFMEVEWLQ